MLMWREERGNKRFMLSFVSFTDPSTSYGSRHSCNSAEGQQVTDYGGAAISFITSPQKAQTQHCTSTQSQHFRAASVVR